MRYLNTVGKQAIFAVAGFLTAVSAQAQGPECQGSDGEKVSLTRQPGGYQLMLEEVNFHPETLVSKLGFKLDNQRYQIRISFDGVHCRENAKFPYLLNCATGAVTGGEMSIVNLDTNQASFRPLSQVGELRFERQITEAVTSNGVVPSDDRLRMKLLAYSADFPFVAGGIARELSFQFAACQS